MPPPGFLQAICSCNNRQIISNQELCLTRLFLDEDQRKKLMLSTRTLPGLEAKQARDNKTPHLFDARRPTHSAATTRPAGGAGGGG